MKTPRLYAHARRLLALLVVLAFGCQDAPRAGPKLGSFVPELVGDAATFSPGAIAATRVEAVLAAHHTVRLLAGTYTLDRPLALTDAHSTSAIVGPTAGGRPLATIVPGWAAPSTELADTPSNSFINATGTLVTSAVNTYLETTALAGSLALTLHAAVTVAADTWMVVEGTNPPGVDEDQGSMSSPVIARELVQVASNVSASATIPLKWPTSVHHNAGAGRTVKGVRPFAGFKFEGVAFDPGSFYIATGLSMDYGYGLDVSHVAGGGFTFAMLRAKASQRVAFSSLHDTGGGHGIVYLDSVQHFTIRDVTSEPGPRYLQPYGVPRAKLTYRTRCTDGAVSHVHLQHGVAGVRDWGAHNVSLSDALIEDMDGTSVMPASVTGGGGRDPENTTEFGIGIDGGGPFIDDNADFSVGKTYSGIRLVNLFDTASGSAGTDVENNAAASFAFFFHDSHQTTIADVQIVNLGADGVYQADSDGVYRHRNGIMCADSTGTAGPVLIRGLLYPLFFQGTCAVDFAQIHLVNAAGAGTNVNRIALNSSVSPSILRLHGDGPTVFFPGASWPVDWSFTVDEFRVDANVGHGVEFAYAASALNDSNGFAYGTPSSGNGAVYTGTGAAAGERRLVAPTAGDTRQAVLVMQGGPFNVTTGMLPVSTRGGSCVVDMAANPGDILKFSGSNQFLTVDNAALVPVAKFTVKRKIAAAGVAECQAL
jgi:hypothetical protein